MPDEIVVGSVLGSFGIRGELKVAAADPEVLQPGLQLRLRRDAGQPVDAALETVRRHKNVLLVRLHGIDDADAAAALRGARLVMARSELPPLPEHTYRCADLVGLQVIDASRGVLGEVTETRHYPSCDMLVVGAAHMLVPLLRAYKVRVDLASREIHVDLPAGFDELT